MRVHKTKHRAVPNFCARHFPIAFSVLLLMILAAPWQAVSAQQADAGPVAKHAPLNAEQVVHNMVQMNLLRAQALRSYRGNRTYRVTFHGFPGTRSAEMIVTMKYLSPGTKEFVVQSVTGSKVIIDKVFKKLLEAETEALAADNQRRSLLTDENYSFTLVGYENGPAGAMYVLQVEPKTKHKFLYRGRIWVDAEDFAVMRLVAEPAKNPSFWTQKTEIVLKYKKVRDFWLPEHNHSVTTMRLGGHAELTIDYMEYKITDSSSVSSLATQQVEALRAKEQAPQKVFEGPVN